MLFFGAFAWANLRTSGRPLVFTAQGSWKWLSKARIHKFITTHGEKLVDFAIFGACFLPGHVIPPGLACNGERNG